MSGQQSLEQVEAICYQRELDRAEAHIDAQGDEPSAEECFERCIHAAACRRIFGSVCHMTITEAMPHAMGCGDACQEYEE